MDEILQDIWVGPWTDVVKHSSEFKCVVCVMDLCELDSEERQDYFNSLGRNTLLIYAPTLRSRKPPIGSFAIPYEYVDPTLMNHIADMVWDRRMNTDNFKVLFHCAAGQERSPLAVIWFLMRHMGMPLDDAYILLKKRHQPTLDRREWLRECLAP